METDQNNKDCIGCRIVSGSGMIGIGVYVASQSKNSINKLGKLFIQTISLGFMSVGIARLLNVYPFNITHQSSKDMGKIEEKKHS